MKKQIGKIGAEVEFWSHSWIDDDFLQAHDIEREYYSEMYELNKFLASWGSAKDIYNFLTNVADTAKSITAKIKKERGHCILATAGHQIDNQSLVFNGLHLHISLNDRREQINRYHNLINTRIVEHWKIDNYPSLRSIASHHIWGALRHQDYDYKRKDKFVPVLWTGLDTIELRIFDNEDILIKSRRKKLASFIFKIFAKDMQKERYQVLPEISSSTDMTQLADCLCKIDRKNHHKVKYLGDSYVEIRNNLDIVKLDLEDNCVASLRRAPEPARTTITQALEAEPQAEPVQPDYRIINTTSGQEIVTSYQAFLRNYNAVTNNNQQD